MEGHQNVSSSTGHSEINRSYYTGNSLSVLHSSQHVYDDSVPTSVHSPPTSQRLFDNTPSCSAISPQLLHRNTGSPALAAMPQVKQCQLRSMWPSHSSHSWSLFSVAMSWLLLHSLLSSLSQYHLQTLLCRPPRHVEFLMTLPLRRRISLVHRYPLMLLSRRLPAVRLPHSWMLRCRRHHPVLFPRTFLRSLAIAQYLRFRLMWHCRLLHIVLFYLTQPHNLTSRSSSLAGFSQTVLWITVIPFASHRQQYRAHMWYPCRRQDLINQLLPP